MKVSGFPGMNVPINDLPGTSLHHFWPVTPITPTAEIQLQLNHSIYIHEAFKI